MERARATWKLLDTSSRTHIDISEPTLTEVNLLEIQIRHPQEMKTVKFSQWKEGTSTGADWEWWLGSVNNWLGLRVQAKRVDRKGSNYTSLNYSNPHGRQVDLLIADASRSGLTPIYCFYNWFRSPQVIFKWRCGSFTPDPFLLGCIVVNASAIRNLINLGRNSLQDVVPLGLPWSCLVCCRGFQRGPLPQRARGVIAALEGADLEIPHLREKPPNYVNSILEGEFPVEGAPEGISYVSVIYEREEG